MNRSRISKTVPADRLAPSMTMALDRARCRPSPTAGARRRRTGITGRRTALVAALASSALAWMPLAPAAAASCAVAYTGDILVDPGATTTLAAVVSGSATAVANRAVTFTLSDGAGESVQYGATSDLGGRAATSAAVPEGVYGVVASVAANALQPGCASPPEPHDALVTVATSGARFAGTGTISPAAGMVRFGLRLRTLDDGTLSGALRLRIHPPNPARPLSFRATTVAYPPTPAVDQCRAEIVGTGTVDGVAGYTYAVTALDAGRKVTDYFALALTAPDGTLVYSTDTLQPLAKGRITAYPPNPARPTSDPCRAT